MQQTELTEFENKKVQHEIKRMAKAINLAFYGRTDIFKGFYALLTARAFIRRYFAEDVTDPIEFKEVRVCLNKVLSEFMQEVFSAEMGAKNE